MSIDACAALVERGDPDRFMATLAGPVETRSALFPIYAFNVEVARAPWLTEEPMIAEMRLQWWRDVLTEIVDGQPVRAHEVTTPLADVLDAQAAQILDKGIAARRWDIYKDAFEDGAHFDEYIDATAGGLMWVAARALGADDALEPVIRDFAFGAGLAAWFRAIPQLEARGRKPLVDGRPGAVQNLAREGLRRLTHARKSRHAVPPRVRPALYPGWQAQAVLRQAASDPPRVSEERLGLSEFRRRLALVTVAATGRW